MNLRFFYRLVMSIGAMVTGNPADKILDHLEYAMYFLDGACWASKLVESEQGKVSGTVTVDGKTVVKLDSYRFITNAIVETGSIYCRKLLSFLGIQLHKKTGLLAAVKNAASSRR